MSLSVELGGVIGGLIALVLITVAMTRQWDRFYYRMGEFEKDLLSLRVRVFSLEQSRESTGSTRSTPGH